MYSPLDIDRIIRTVYGEAALEPAQGQQAVASVILNRARSAGMSPADIVMQPNQFEPWGKRRKQLEGLKPDSPIYRQIAERLQPLLDGNAADPTGGADHFYSPTAQKALGRSDPSWASGQPGTDIGRHRFFKLGYGGAQPQQPQQVASAQPSLVGQPNDMAAEAFASGQLRPEGAGIADPTMKGMFLQGQGTGIQQQPQPPMDIGPEASGDNLGEDPGLPPEQPQQQPQSEERPGFFSRLREAGVGPALTRFGAGLAAGASKGWGAGIGMGLEGAADAMDTQRAFRISEGKQNLSQLGPQIAYRHYIDQGMSPKEALLRAFSPDAVGKWDTQIVGETADGKKIYRQVNSVTGETRDVPGVAAGGGEVDDADPMAGLDENSKVIVKALSEYGLDPTKVTSLRGNRRENLLARAKRLNPELDLGNYSNIYATRSSFQGGKDSQALRSADQAIHHAGLLLDKFDTLNKAGGGPAKSGEYGPLTDVYNRGREFMLGQSGSEELTGAGMPVQALASEVAKIFHGVGAVPLAEIEEIQSKFNTHMTPEQQKEATTSLLQLMSGAIQSYKNKYENAVGAAYAAKHPFETVFRLDPHSVAVLKRLNLSPEHFGLKGDAAGGPEEFASRTNKETPTAGDTAEMPKNLPPEHQELWQHYDEKDRAYLIKKYGG
jgi:hypothetical protein